MSAPRPRGVSSHFCLFLAPHLVLPVAASCTPADTLHLPCAAAMFVALPFSFDKNPGCFQASPGPTRGSFCFKFVNKQTREADCAQGVSCKERMCLVTPQPGKQGLNPQPKSIPAIKWRRGMGVLPLELATGSTVQARIARRSRRVAVRCRGHKLSQQEQPMHEQTQLQACRGSARGGAHRAASNTVPKLQTARGHAARRPATAAAPLQHQEHACAQPRGPAAPSTASL